MIFGTTKQQNTIFSRNKQHKITTWFYIQNVAMMRSDLSTFLPTLGLLGAVLKKIRLRRHKKHQKSTLKTCGTVIGVAVQQLLKACIIVGRWQKQTKLSWYSKLGGLKFIKFSVEETLFSDLVQPSWEGD